MTRDEATAILDLPREEAIAILMRLVDPGEETPSSPTTPSGMIPVYHKPARRGRRKRPGQKSGHPGCGRSRPRHIDQSVIHRLTHCPDCRTPVQRPVRVYRRVIEDLPPVEPIVTEHVVKGYWCPTCRKIVSPPVTAALPNAQLGLRLLVMTAWLHYLVGMSVNHLVALLQVTAGVTLSPGGLTQAWQSLARSLWPDYQAIHDLAHHSAVLQVDETGWRLNGITHWLWCFTNQTVCLYLITRSRGSPVIKQVLGLLFKGIMICDFWGAYNKISTLATQRCFYHLFTELVKVDQRNGSPAWRAFRTTLSRLLKDAIRLSQRSEVNPATRERLLSRLKARLEKLIGEPADDPDVRRLIKRLKRHRHELFTFIKHEKVSPYNNHAEQQMRKAVLCRKISQQNRSESGAVTQAVLMSLFRTAELQKKNPVETVLTAAQSAIENGKPATPDFKLIA